METEVDLKIFGFSIDEEVLLSSKKARLSITETGLQPNPIKLFGVEIDPNDNRPRRAHAHEPENPNLPLTDLKFLARVGAYCRSVQLIMTRNLPATDLSRAHGRLSMPFGQVKPGFLKPEEEASIESRDKQGNQKAFKNKDVMVVGPSRRFYKMKLAKWNYNPVKNTSCWYALIGGWIPMADDNHIVSGDTIQVWSFRFLDADGSLGFLIRKIQ